MVENDVDSSRLDRIDTIRTTVFPQCELTHYNQRRQSRQISVSHGLVSRWKILARIAFIKMAENKVIKIKSFCHFLDCSSLGIVEIDNKTKHG